MNSSLPGAKLSPFFKKMRRRFRSARRWSVTAGITGGVAAVLLPYQGLGAPDAVWAGLFGGSAIFATLRWIDYRQLAKRQPAEQEKLAVHGTAALAAEAQHVVHGLAGLLQNKRHAAKFRHSAASKAYRRLQQAAMALDELMPQLAANAREIVDDARSSQRSLHDLAGRIRSVEKSMSMPSTAQALRGSHAAMVERFELGTAAFEDMVGAVATVVAEQSALDGMVGSQDLTMVQLSEATEKLHAQAHGIEQMRDFHNGQFEL